MDRVLSDIIKFTSKYNVSKVALFGSRARGDFNEKSDYDIAISAPLLNQEEKNMLLDEIEAIDTLYKLDVVFINAKTSSELLRNIEKDGVIIMDKFQIKLNNYKNALQRLHEAIEQNKERDNEVLRDGAIQRFEFTTELAWKTLREYLLSMEVSDINTPRAVLKEAFANNLINEEEKWITILRDRNSTSHIYDSEEAEEVYGRIAQVHIHLFDSLLKVLETK